MIYTNANSSEGTIFQPTDLPPLEDPTLDPTYTPPVPSVIAEAPLTTNHFLVGIDINLDHDVEAGMPNDDDEVYGEDVEPLETEDILVDILAPELDNETEGYVVLHKYNEVGDLNPLPSCFPDGFDDFEVSADDQLYLFSSKYSEVLERHFEESDIPTKPITSLYPTKLGFVTDPVVVLDQPFLDDAGESIHVDIDPLALELSTSSYKEVRQETQTQRKGQTIVNKDKGTVHSKKSPSVSLNGKKVKIEGDPYFVFNDEVFSLSVFEKQVDLHNKPIIRYNSLVSKKALFPIKSIFAPFLTKDKKGFENKIGCEILSISDITIYNYMKAHGRFLSPEDPFAPFQDKIWAARNYYRAIRDKKSRL